MPTSRNCHWSPALGHASAMAMQASPSPDVPQALSSPSLRADPWRSGTRNKRLGACLDPKWKLWGEPRPQPRLYMLAPTKPAAADEGAPHHGNTCSQLRCHSGTELKRRPTASVLKAAKIQLKFRPLHVWSAHWLTADLIEVEPPLL